MAYEIVQEQCSKAQAGRLCHSLPQGPQRRAVALLHIGSVLAIKRPAIADSQWQPEAHAGGACVPLPCKMTRAGSMHPSATTTPGSQRKLCDNLPGPF
jgi:hypothetical protein